MEIMSIEGGRGERSMGNSIKNFHFVSLNTSLRMLRKDSVGQIAFARAHSGTVILLLTLAMSSEL